MRRSAYQRWKSTAITDKDIKNSRMNEWPLFEFRASIAVCVSYSLLASLWLQRLHGLSEAVGGWCRGARCFCLVSIIDCSISAESAVQVLAILLTSAFVGVLTVEFTHLSKRICARHVRDRYITHLAASGARQLYVHTVWWLDVQLIPLSYGRTYYSLYPRTFRNFTKHQSENML